MLSLSARASHPPQTSSAWPSIDETSDLRRRSTPRRPSKIVIKIPRGQRLDLRGTAGDPANDVVDIESCVDSEGTFEVAIGNVVGAKLNVVAT